MVTESSEVVAVCQSLQQVAEKCQQDPESYWYFHKTAVPCLFALAVQASMPGDFSLLPSCSRLAFY
jgi:DNA repair/transcription protein MET18/MMS19